MKRAQREKQAAYRQQRKQNGSLYVGFYARPELAGLIRAAKEATGLNLSQMAEEAFRSYLTDGRTFRQPTPEAESWQQFSKLAETVQATSQEITDKDWEDLQP